MAEDENGFTFVDKRRMAAEPAEPPSETPAQSQPQTATQENSPFEAAGGEGDAGDEGQAPDVYSMIGYCISLLSAEAWQKLGLLADPTTGEASPDLPQAKVAIDAVSDLAARLESAPEEIVPASLRRDLRSLMNDLRLNYVAQRDASSPIARP